MKTKDKWDEVIKALPKKSRVMRHLSIYDYINSQDNIRIVPMHLGRGYNAAINIQPSKNPNAPFVIKKTDPNKDFPHFTSDVARIVGKNPSFIAKMSRKLNIRNNEEYCYLHKLKGGENPKYSDKGLNFIKGYLEKNINYWPY